MSKNIKIGDKVKVLSSALDIFVHPDLIGETVKVSNVYANDYTYSIGVRDSVGLLWGLRDEDFIRIPGVGEQLLFLFMLEEE